MTKINSVFSFKIFLILISLFFLVAAPAIAQDSPIDDTVEDMSDESADDVRDSTEKPSAQPKVVPQSTTATPPANKKDVVTTQEEPLPFIKSKKERFDGQGVGTRYIEHPNAKKGLIRIDKDKAYYYKVKTSEQKEATSVHFATYEPVDLVNPDNSDLRFDNIYDNESWPLITYEKEYQFMQSFGKLAWKWGTGLFVARGNGQFENPQAEEPLEEFTLMVFPANIGVIYRAQYWDTQIIVPYAEASVGGFCFAEIRDDDQNPSLGAALGFAPMAQLSGGASFQLGTDSSSFLDLDREYGINRVFLDVEYRAYLALGDFDFSANVIAVGLTAEY